MKFYCIKSVHYFTAGKVYEGKISNDCYLIQGDGGNGLFTLEPDKEGQSYKDWFALEAPTYKDFDSMTKAELQEARADLMKRLRSTINPTKVIKLSNSGVVVQGGRLEGEFIAKVGSLYVRGTNSSTGYIPVSQLKHAENVLKRFYARHVGGFDLD